MISQKIASILSLLVVAFLMVGCGNSQENFVFTNTGANPNPGTNPVVVTNDLAVSLAPNALAQADISAQVSDLVTEVRFELYRTDNFLGESQTVGRSQQAVFTNLPDGSYLVRALGLDANDAVLGYFDLVVNVSDDLNVIIPGLRNDSTPPDVVFPQIGNENSFFLFTARPDEVAGGETFTVSARAYNSQGQALSSIVNNVTLQGDEIELVGEPVIQNSQSDGRVTFSGLSFANTALGTTALSISAPGFDTEVSTPITVVEPVLVVSKSDQGTPGDAYSDDPASSADGRFVAFESAAANLVVNDTNDAADIFVFDRQNQTITRVSVATGGVQANGASSAPDISGDGRLVVFYSPADNLVANDTNNRSDVFLHDRQTGTTQRISVDESGDQLVGSSAYTSISADGRFVTYASQGDPLGVVGDNTYQVYLYEVATGDIEIVSVDANGDPGSSDSYESSISSDGSRVAFTSTAALVAEDAGSDWDVYLYDRTTDALRLLSESADGSTSADGFTDEPAISADGQFVVFYSLATNLVTPATVGNISQVYIHDVAQDTLELLSVDGQGEPGNGDSFSRAISGDGRFVVIHTQATNIVTPDNNAAGDLVVYDRLNGTRSRIQNLQGEQLDGSTFADQDISDDGRFIAFSSTTTNLVTGGVGGVRDVFSILNPLFP